MTKEEWSLQKSYTIYLPQGTWYNLELTSARFRKNDLELGGHKVQHPGWYQDHVADKDAYKLWDFSSRINSFICKYFRRGLMEVVSGACLSWFTIGEHWLRQLSYYNKVPQTEYTVNNRKVYLKVQEAGCPNSRYKKICFCLRASSVFTYSSIFMALQKGTQLFWPPNQTLIPLVSVPTLKGFTC